jgi:hypothetical protein
LGKNNVWTVSQFLRIGTTINGLILQISIIKRLQKCDLLQQFEKLRVILPVVELHLNFYS